MNNPLVTIHTRQGTETFIIVKKLQLVRSYNTNPLGYRRRKLFWDGIAPPKDGALTIAFYNHIKKTHPLGYGNR